MTQPPENTMNIDFERDGFRLSLARTAADIRAAQRLRYNVFVTELGGQGAGVDHGQELEADPFDAHADHLILRTDRSDDAIGVYRVMQAHHAKQAGRYYSAQEFDLAPLQTSGRRLLELGRSCVAADHRGGAAMFQLWTGLARYVAASGAEILFGTASLPGTDMNTLAGPLSLLHRDHLAPGAMRPRSRAHQRMDLVPHDQLDRRAAMVAVPSLIKSYLRLGGRVGDGAFVDHAFNCTDVCMVMDTAALNARHAQRYQVQTA